MRLGIYFQHRVFLLPSWQWVQTERFSEACATSTSHYFQLVQLITGPVKSCLVTYRKKLEEMDFVDEEFLHKKINNKEVYMWIMWVICAIEDIPENSCSS